MKRGFVVGIMLMVSLPSFAQWEPDRQITNYPGYHDYGSHNNAWTIAVQDSLVHIVWEHRDATSVGLYYVRSTDYGTTFDPHQQLTTQSSHCPSICVFDSFVHIAWHDDRDGNPEIYYNRSIDYGASWDIDNLRLTNDAAYSGYPSICCSDSCIHIAWQDNKDGNREIYYNRSADYGLSWAGNERLTVDGGISDLVSVACTKCPYDVHIAWTDWRDGIEEIYYKRHKCPTAGVSEDKELRVESLELRVFPNPSTTVVRIQWLGVNERQKISLTVYDLGGRLVKTLLNNEVISGNEIEVNLEELAKGIYFVRMDVGDFKATKKIILMR